MIMKKFEVLQELPKRDTQTQSKQYCWRRGAERLTQCRVATNLQFV